MNLRYRNAGVWCEAAATGIYRAPVLVAGTLICALWLLTSSVIARDLTFLATSDLHYGVANTINPAQITAMNSVGSATASGVVVLGDLTDTGWPFSTFESHYPVNGGTGATKIHFPVYELPGNHDHESDWWAWLVETAVEGVERRHGAANYSWNWDGVHMVNCDVYPSDLAWLGNDLAGVAATTPIVISQHVGFDADSQTYWDNYATESAEFKNIIGQHNVIAILHGHIPIIPGIW
jgi:Calcineurin-like phosphoesterase